MSFLNLVKQLEDQLTESEWAEAYVMDSKEAIHSRKITLCWRETQQPVPLDLNLSEEAYNRRGFTWRDVHRRMKDCLPKNMLKQSISEANSILRNANRRSTKDISKDFKNWRETTAELLDHMFGFGVSQNFKEDSVLPTHLQAGSMQAVHFLFEQKIDYLKSF